MNERTQATGPNIHNGTYTVDHPEQGHFTVKLHTAQKGALATKRLISLLTGPDNENSFTAVAFWNDDNKRALVWKRFKGADSRLPIDGYHDQDKGWSSVEKRLAIWCDLAVRGDGTSKDWSRGLCGTVRKGYWAGEGYTLLVEGRCVVCNRKLTDPESIRTGIGPKCGGRS